MKKHLLLLLALLSFAASRLVAGDFTLETKGFDTRIQYRGAPFIESVVTRVLPKGAFAPDAKSTLATLPDGARVFNIWSENHASEFRQEVAVAPDGGSAPAATDDDDFSGSAPADIMAEI